MTLKKYLMIGGALAVMVTGASHFAQAQDSDDLDIEATVIAAIDIACGTTLNFGTLSPTAAAGTLVVTTAGGVTPTNVTALGGHAAGQCTVTGEADQAYDLTFEAGPILIDDGGLNDMEVDTFVVNIDGGGDQGGPYAGALAGGTDTVVVGATLNVDANQPAGVYNGTVEITVDYQ